MSRTKHIHNSECSPWSEENIQRAVKAVKDNNLTIRQATRMFEVPCGTLQDRVKGRFPTKKYKIGRRSVLTNKQKWELASYVISFSKVFYDLAQHILKSM